MAQIKELINNPKTLVDCLLVYENYPAVSALSMDVKVNRIKYYEQTNYSFNCIVSQYSGSLLFRINYNCNKYSEHNINAFLNTMLVVCHEVIRSANCCIGEICFQSSYDKKIQSMLKTDCLKIDRGDTIDRMYIECRSRCKGRTAILDLEGEISYDDLDNISNYYSNKIMMKSSSSIVAVYMERSIALVISLLAIVKAGKAYAVIHPDYPIERSRFILEDTGCDMVLTIQKYSEKLWNLDSELQVLFVEQSYIKSEEGLYVKTRNDILPHDILYLVYTSGTTGYPKGIMVPHRTLCNLIRYQQSVIAPDCSERVLMFANPCFDVCYQEIFSTLLSGGTLCVVTEQMKQDPILLMDFIKENMIKTAFFPTAWFNNVLQDTSYVSCIPECLNEIVVAGEALIIQHEAVRELRKRGIRILNHYGPSETHVCTTKVIENTEIEEGKPTIGRPIQKNNIEIWNKYCQQVPVSVVGEIVVTGENISAGYLNQSELTHKRFIKQGDKIFYCTNDYGYINALGEIVYVGRGDRQLKIRGYRVELGEIEETARRYLPVKNVVAYWAEDQNLYLIIMSEISFTEEFAKEALSKYLAAYMIPNGFIFVEDIPLTDRGKIDYSKIRYMVDCSKRENKEEMVLDSNSNEEQRILHQVWSEVLGKSVGIDENFFAKGGDSIKALLVVSKLGKKGFKIAISDLYKNPTIKLLAKQVVRIVTQRNEMVSRTINLTPIQKMFFQYKHKDENRWNQSILLFSKEHLNSDKLKVCWRILLNHHDALRIQFRKEDKSLIQVNMPVDSQQIIIEEYNLCMVEESEKQIHNICDRIQSELDIFHGPLIKCALFKTQDGDHLLIAVHHLIIDAVSWRILIEDLVNIYRMEKPIGLLHGKTTSYAMWSDIIYDYVESSDLKHQFAYWKEISKISDTKIIDYNYQNDYVEDSESISISLSEEETNLLIYHTNLTYHTTINDILLAALTLALKETFNIYNKRIMLESHGRIEEIATQEIDLSRTVGWFTCMYPIVLRTDITRKIDKQILMTKKELNSVPHKGIGYGILKYIAEEKIFAIDDCEISFNYLGQFDETFKITDLCFSDIDPGSMTSPKNKRLFPISITGQTYNKKTSFFLDYNKKFYNFVQMNEFIQCYKRKLREVIIHCQIKRDRSIEKNIDIYPLSVQQKQMLFHYLMNTETPLYLIQYSCELSGDVKFDILKNAYEGIIRKYDALRTAISDGIDYEQQVVLPEVSARFQFIDLSNKNNKEVEKEIALLVQKDRQTPFILENGNLSRMTVIRKGEKSVMVIWTLHHIITDGWSVNLLFADLFKSYRAKLRNTEEIADEKYSYKKYIEWIISHLHNIDEDHFWKNYLCGYQNNHLLNVIKTDKEINIHKCWFTIDFELQCKIDRFSVTNKITNNIVCMSAWGVMLGALSQHEDVVFGVIISGRPPELVGVEQMVGLFVQTIPVRMSYSLCETFHQIVQNTYNQQKILQSKILGPSQELNNSLHINYSDILFIYENYPNVDEYVNDLEKAEFEVTNCNVYSPIACPLALVIEPQKNLIEINYDKNQYSKEYINFIGKQYMLILLRLLDNPNISVNELKLVNNNEL